MQRVLALDASYSPPRGIVALLDGSAPRVLERVELPTPPVTVAETEGAAPSETPATPVQFVTESPYENSVVVVPPDGAVTVTLELPFTDPAQIRKILPSELQDLLPFSVSEFAISFRVTNLKGRSGNPVIHATLLPKSQVAATLSNLKQFGIDPIVVGTPATALEQIFSQLPAGTPASIAVVLSQKGALSAVVRCEGEICMTLSLPESLLGDDSRERYIARMLLSLERKTGRGIEKILWLGDPLRESARSHFTVPMESLSIMGDGPDSELLTTLASLSATDEHAAAVYTNFRVGEFSFRPPLRELLRSLRMIAPWVTLVALLGVGLVAVQYFARAWSNSEIQRTIAEEIRLAAPGVVLPTGEELNALSLEINKIDQELKDLGSPTGTSAADALLAISAAFPESTKEVGVNRITIRGNKIKIEGCAPEYGAIEQVKTALKRSKEFATVKDDVAAGCPGGTAGQRGYSFEIWLRE